MSNLSDYQTLDRVSVYNIVSSIDQDVERGEDILMLGYGLVMMAPLFAPVAPPYILLPAMALCFVASVCRARFNFYNIQKYATPLISRLPTYQLEKIQPIAQVLGKHPLYTLSEGFNPFKNLLRTGKSFLGSLMINPFWMPIFYVLGLQFAEEKQLRLLNQAVIQVEQHLKF